jgi:hypothetical protein
MNGWEKMFEHWQKEYYSEPFYLACQILAIVLGFTYQRKSKVGRFFILYAIFDFLMLNLLLYLDYFSGIEKSTYRKATNVINSLCFLAEFLAFCYFFTQTLQNKKIYGVLKSIRIAFILLLLFYLVNAFVFNVRPSTTLFYLGAIGYLFLLIPSFTYYYELFTKPSSQNLFKRPSFWITSGIFFISFLSIPYYTIASYLGNVNYQYSNSLGIILFTIPYGIRFLFLSKAFTLKTKLTT